MLALATNEAKCVFAIIESFVNIWGAQLLLGDEPALRWDVIVFNLAVVLAGSFLFLHPDLTNRLITAALARVR